MKKRWSPTLIVLTTATLVPTTLAYLATLAFLMSMIFDADFFRFSDPGSPWAELVILGSGYALFSLWQWLARHRTTPFHAIPTYLWAGQIIGYTIVAYTLWRQVPNGQDIAFRDVITLYVAGGGPVLMSIALIARSLLRDPLDEHNP